MTEAGAMLRQPSLFIPHGGGPCFFMPDPRFTFTGARQHPGLIFDYYGFPPETYALEWAAPGAPGWRSGAAS